MIARPSPSTLWHHRDLQGQYVSAWPASKHFREFRYPELTGSGKLFLTLRTAYDTPPGSYQLAVAGKSGSLLHSVEMELRAE